MDHVASIELTIKEFRRILPDASETAQSIDRREPPRIIAHNAVNEGYSAFANALVTMLVVSAPKP